MGVDAAEPSSVIYSLLARDLVPDSLARLYFTLRDARNVIAHTQALPDDRDAEEFARQVDYLEAFLILLKGKVRKGNDGAPESDTEK